MKTKNCFTTISSFIFPEIESKRNKQNNLENKLQKTLIKGIAVISLTALTSLSGCRSYLHNCSAYTYNNGKEREITKIDTADIVMDYSKQNYQLQTSQSNN